MKAMVLAAGLGTRLKPLTDGRPKALVELNHRALLEIVLTRLRDSGIFDVIINVHHFADLIVEYLAAHDNFGMRIAISREDILLDTGGGLKKAAWFFLQDSEQQPFLLHNVDVLSTIDFSRMEEFHRSHAALATLAVKNRETSRYLIFDERNNLCGRQSTRDPEKASLAFSGIHVISPRLLPLMPEEGVYSIIPTYLDLASRGEKILAFGADEYYWRDLGKPKDLDAAAEDATRGIVKL